MEQRNSFAAIIVCNAQFVFAMFIRSYFSYTTHYYAQGSVYLYMHTLCSLNKKYKLITNVPLNQPLLHYMHTIVTEIM